VAGADSPELVAVWSNGSDRTDGLRTALVVDRRVRHLETQLYVNGRRRAFFARIFGLDADDESPRTHGRQARSALLHPGNEYFDERCRLRMLRAGDDASLPPASTPPPLASSVAPSTPVEPQQDDDPESGASQSLQSDNQPTTLPPAVESTELQTDIN